MLSKYLKNIGVKKHQIIILWFPQTHSEGKGFLLVEKKSILGRKRVQAIDMVLFAKSWKATVENEVAKAGCARW
jgi:hypothetical protein